MFEQSVSRYPLPWLTTYARRMRDLFGGDPFPFGIENNRKALEAITQFAFDQQMVPRKYAVEELFAPVN